MKCGIFPAVNSSDLAKWVKEVLRDRVGIDHPEALKTYTLFSNCNIGDYELEELAGAIEERFDIYPEGCDIECWINVAKVVCWIEKETIGDEEY